MFRTDKKTFDEAVATCQSQGLSMLKVASSTDVKALNHFCAGIDSNCWLGELIFCLAYSETHVRFSFFT